MTPNEPNDETNERISEPEDHSVPDDVDAGEGVEEEAGENGGDS